MSSKSKSKSFNQTKKTISKFDHGPSLILDFFPTLTKQETISLQLLFFSLLEIISSDVTNNDPIKTKLVFKLIIDSLQRGKIFPKSMSLTALKVRQTEYLQNYVNGVRDMIQATLRVVQHPLTSQLKIAATIENDNIQTLAMNPQLPNLLIDIPQPDIQLKLPLSLKSNGTLALKDLGNIVIFRYIRDFYEIGRLGKGAFGSVFTARNYLDGRRYAIKKIIFKDSNNRTRRQAEHALQEVRILASLSHPNIVQYHCAWLELVPIDVPIQNISQRLSLPTSPLQKDKLTHPVKQDDSLDSYIEFKEHSSSLPQNKTENNETRSSIAFSSISATQDDDDDDGDEHNEMSIFEQTDRNSNTEIHNEHQINNNNPLINISTLNHQDSISVLNKNTNKELVPLHARNQTIHATTQKTYTNTKMVLFIQMQLCDTTLYDWLRLRDQTIIDETSDENKQVLYSLNEFGQKQCWQIFEQLLTAVQYLHLCSFVHRDIKPRNIFLSYDSIDKSIIYVKLGDFGLATLMDPVSAPDSPKQFINDESTGVGTALYASPEQFNKKHCEATDQSDLYSLGIVLYELFNIFTTEMERCHCLSNLRVDMKVENTFSKLYPFETNIIEQLVSIESNKRPNVEQLLTRYKNERERRIEKQRRSSKQLMIDKLQEQLHHKDQIIQQLENELEINKL